MLCPVTSENFRTVTFTQIFLFIVSSYDGRGTEHKAFICDYYVLSYEIYSHYIFKVFCNAAFSSFYGG